MQIPWDQLTLTGRLLSAVDGAIPLSFLFWCFVCMLSDLCIYFAASMVSYRIVLWTFFTPAERGFYCNDKSIRKQLHPNTIPTLTLLALALMGPFFVIVIAALLRRLKCHSDYFKRLLAHSTNVYKDYISAFWTMLLGLEILKCYTGRIRPNFLAMCNPKELEEICASSPTEFVPIAHCLAGWKDATNSKQSFPSGHAAVSVFCTLFLIFYLRGLQERLPYLRLKIMFYLVSFLFVVFTIFCCISRVTDCRHFISDVLGGIIYGAIQFFLLLQDYV